jgi:hypothetical protein
MSGSNNFDALFETWENPYFWGIELLRVKIVQSK